jgi:hypothetical protein
MAAISASLERTNSALALELEQGRLYSDMRLVHIEQTVVQGHLDKLRADNPAAYARVIREVNSFLNARGVRGFLAESRTTDAAYARVLDAVRGRLGRDIDFGRQLDREMIGNQLVSHIRSTGGCDIVGSRIRSC